MVSFPHQSNAFDQCLEPLLQIYKHFIKLFTNLEQPKVSEIFKRTTPQTIIENRHSALLLQY